MGTGNGPERMEEIKNAISTQTNSRSLKKDEKILRRIEKFINKKNIIWIRSIGSREERRPCPPVRQRRSFHTRSSNYHLLIRILSHE